MYDQELYDHVAARCESQQNGCWVWKKSRTERQYGQTMFRQKFWRAHRAIFVAIHGPISAETVVRHKCDNPPCCNPLHLESGTATDNRLDAAKRGRLSNTKFTAKQVLAIRSDERSARKIAAELGVSHSAVVRIRKGDRWNWL